MTIRLIAASLFLTSLIASASSGKTADGCTYRIINGQYLTSCDTKPSEAAAPIAESIAPAQQITYVAAAAPVSSYGDVPVRYNAAAPAPAPLLMRSIETPSQSAIMNEAYETKRNKERNRALDATYAGIQLGSTSIKNADSGLGLGVSVGSLIDDHFGFELGYSYAKQDLNLGLNTRGAELPEGGLGSYPSVGGADATLNAHMVSGEFQGYHTHTFKRLRPFLGLGLGWKSSSLKEKSQGGSYPYESYGSTQPISSSLSQSTLNALASAGAKFRIAKAFHLGFSLRYFFPIARQEAKYTQGNAGYGYGGQLTKEDDGITGAAQSQIAGGLLYSF